MRTTLNLRDEALELCRSRAESRGVSLGEAASEAILMAYGEKPSAAQRKRSDLPVSGEGGLRPGVDLDDRAALEEIMAGRA